MYSLAKVFCALVFVVGFFVMIAGLSSAHRNDGVALAVVGALGCGTASLLLAAAMVCEIIERNLQAIYWWVEKSQQREPPVEVVKDSPLK